jgi:hypothetical protein
MLRLPMYFGALYWYKITLVAILCCDLEAFHLSLIHQFCCTPIYYNV